VGDSAVVPEGVDCAIGQNLVILRSDETHVDQRFLRWATRGPLWAEEVNRLRNVGAVFDSLNVRDLARIRIPAPPKREQRAIAAVLGALDDKIDSNRRLATVLEEVATTEFRARFVDFITDNTIDRAPLPDGWTTGTLGDVGTAHREFVRGEHAAPYIGLDVMPRGSTVLAEWLTESAPTGQAATFDGGDILFGKLRPYFRKVGVAPIAGRCSTEILVLRPTKPEYYGVLLGHVASDRFIEHCDAVSRGTRMPRAEWRDAATFEIAIPPPEVAAEFCQLVRTLYSQIIALTHQSRSLAATRDALLPKLISGELRVPDTADPEEVIGPAAGDAAAAA
jgi:type I restriction enzyme S subunit